MDQALSYDSAATPERSSSPTVARAQASVLEEDKHATRLLDPNQIRMSAVMDRIDPADGLEGLIASIKEHGQRVPVLVRKVDGAFEIVYGRRRLLACRALGMKIRASVMEMTDEEALIAQGVENNARQDPSFIERALFVAGIIRELGKSEASRKNAQTVAYRALQIDESLVSRMNKIATSIPIELIKAIGPAPGSGRRVWERLAKLCEARPALAANLAAKIPAELPSSARVETAISLLTPPEKPAIKAQVAEKVNISRSGGRLTIEADRKLLPLLEEHIRKAVAEFLDRGQDEVTAPETPNS